MTERHGDREDHPVSEPAPTITEKSRSDEWRLRNNAQPNATERSATEPAPTLTAGHDSGERVWVTRNGGWGESFSRSEDKPAPTLTGDGLGKGRDVWMQMGDRVQEGGGNVPRSAEEPSATLGSRTDLAKWTEDRPAPTITTTRRSEDGLLVGRQLPEGEGKNVGGQNWGDKGDPPSTTVAGDPRIPPPGHHGHGEQGGPDAIRVTAEEAAALQSFPPGFPFQGSKTSVHRQIGNAVPPLLAKAVLEAVLSTALVRGSHW